jgi:alpha-beta hydrolase superfamily lysophospholipase
MLLVRASLTLKIGVFLLSFFLQGCASFSQAPPASPIPAAYERAPGASEHRIMQTRSGLRLFGQWWEPEQPADAVVLLLHGTLVHSGFYYPWAQHLNDHGYAVFAIDLRGWGQSQGYGRRGLIYDYDEYLEDAVLAYQEVRRRYPELPVYLQGESMGGVIALLSQVENRFDVDGLILNAPAVQPGLSLGPVRFPMWMHRVGLWGFSLPGRAYPNMPTPVPGPVVELGIPLILKDKEARVRFKQDPHSLHRALPYSYFNGLRVAGGRTRDGLASVDSPVIIIHGTRDALVPPRSSQNTLDNLGGDDKTLKIHPRMSHAGLHDVQRMEVWADIIEWLEARRPQSGNHEPAVVHSH